LSRRLVIPALMVLIFLGQAACSKEEKTKPPLDSFIGTWKATTWSAGVMNYEYFHTYVFKEDSTFTYHKLTKFEEQRINEYMSGTFTVYGNKLILHVLEPTESTAEYYFEFSSDSVTLTSVSDPSDVKKFEYQG